MDKKILCLPGDGIGPEIMAVAREIIDATADRFSHSITWDEGLIGFAAWDKLQDTMPEETWEKMRASEGVLFGAVGLPDRDAELAPEMRPEKRALLAMRKEFGLSINIRPVKIYPGLESLSPLKNHLCGGVDLTFFRELNSGIYFGKKERDPGGEWAKDECYYAKPEIEKIARSAFELAKRSGLPVTSVDKANVLGAIGLFWREVVTDLHQREFSDVELQHCLVDAFNLYLFTNPKDYRIVLTSNMFGDILSDGAAGLVGSLGLLPSASLNPDSDFCLFEPSGGSAPDIAGKNLANPIAMILCGALLFRHTFKDEAAAQQIEKAVQSAMEEGYRTRDLLLGEGDNSSLTEVGTKEMSQAILKHI